MSEPMTEEDLFQKHKKERKDLQAKIQNIKKTADKKKKKESRDLIASMELELEKQQEKELNDLKLELEKSQITGENNIDEDIEENSSEPKIVQHITRAQKRRNKKSMQEKENQERIAEQEIKNQTGVRNLEIQAIQKILDSKELSLHVVPSDGDCLYQAISHQLELRNISKSVKELRAVVAEYLRENKDSVLPFLITDTDDIMSDESFDKYCNSIVKTKCWGGHVELMALSKVLESPIHVLQASGPPTILGEEYSKEPLMITYHRHMYRLGEHYNSTKPKVCEEIELN